MHVSNFYSAPEYGDLLSKQIEYTPPIPIRILNQGPEVGIDLGPCTLKDDYWVPSPELRPHMRMMVKKDAAKKLRVADSGLANPNFGKFPCGYPDFRLKKAIKVGEKSETRVFHLSEMLIDDCVRLGRLSPVGDIELQRANYLDQLGSNINCRERFVREASDGHGEPYVPFRTRPDALTFRQLDADPLTGRLRPLIDCHQANTVGVGALFLDHDGVPLLRPRAEDLAVMERGLHWTSSGAMQWQDIPADPARSVAGIAEAMHREIWEETAMPRDDYVLVPLCFAREFARGGKPQFFFVAGFRQELRFADGSLTTYLKSLGPARDRWEVSEELQSEQGFLKQVLSFISKKSGKVEYWYLSENMSIDRLDVADPLGFPLWAEMTYECKAALYFVAFYKGALLVSASR